MLQISLEDRIHVVTFDHPPDNKFNGPLFEAMGAGLDELLGPDSDIVVFTGAGRSFSKGFDLDLIRSSRDSDALREHLVSLNDICTRILRAPKPTIAAINGHCFGGGLELALVCHFRLGAEKARIGLPESSAGIVPGLGGTHRLARVVGPAKALELVAMGDMVPAEEAMRLNLLNRVFPKKSFMDHVMTFARTIQMLSPELMREILSMIDKADCRSEEENVAAAIDAFVKVAPWMQEAL